MPLSDLQVAILRTLSRARSAESYVAGAIAITADSDRVSRDIDLFHDRKTVIADIAERDAETLRTAGFGVRFVRAEPGVYGAIVSGEGAETSLEWVTDSDFRFFPLVEDELFGRRLHVFDIATNKALACAGRDEPRDVIDLLHVHDTIVPLGAVILAAVGKDPGYTPEFLIAEMRRSARYRQDDFDSLLSAVPIDAADVSRRFKQALREAEDFVRRMPGGYVGHVFLRDGRVVQPDPARLDAYEARPGTRGGYWPSTSEIASEMLKKAGNGE